MNRYELGTIRNPYSYLMQALSEINNSEVTIYLLNHNNSPHFLDGFNSELFDVIKDNVPQGSSYYVSSAAKNILITPCTCDIAACDGKCYNTNDKAVLKWKRSDTSTPLLYAPSGVKLTLKNVDIDGKDSLVNDCSSSNDFCTYCHSYTTYDSEEATTDQDIRIPKPFATSEHCLSYSGYDLFLVEDAGSLRLENVRIHDWRAQFRSLIHLSLTSSDITATAITTSTTYDVTTPTLIMSSVYFENVMASTTSSYSAIILVDSGPSSSDNLSKISYYDGSVSLINNGNEHSEALGFPGFLYASFLDTLELENVEFKYNLVYKGIYDYGDVSDSGMIYINSINKLSIKSCKFLYNIVSSSIFNIQISSAYQEPVQSSSYYITFENNEFSNNSGPLVYIYSEVEHPFLTFKSNKFTNNLAFYSTYKMITLEVPFKTEFYYGDNNISTRYATFESNTFTFCYSDSQLISLTNLVNVVIKDLTISDSLEKYESSHNYIQDLVYSKFKGKSYISKDLSIIFWDYSHTSNMIILEGIRGLSLSSLKILNNYSSGGCIEIYCLNLYGNFSVSSAIISGNTCNGQYSMGIYSMNALGDLEIKDFQARNNTNKYTFGFGVLYLNTIGDNRILKITNSDFSFISTGRSPVAYLNYNQITIDNSSFEYNEIDNPKSAALYIDPPVIDKTKSPTVLISNIIFKYNSNKSSGGGSALYIDQSTEKQTNVNLYIFNCTFFSNKSKTNGAALVISSKIHLADTSMITSCTFQENTSTISGNLMLEYASGSLTFSKCTFTKNTSIEGVALFIAISSGAQLKITESKITSNNSNSNSSGSVIAFSVSDNASKLITEACTFSENQATVVTLESGSWLDTNSQFTNNKAYSSTVLDLSSSSVASMTDSVIDSNIAHMNGGVFGISGFSKLNLKQCTISDNVSNRNGGVIFMEQNSRFTIYNSFFSGNKATYKGSVIYAIGCDKHFSEIYSSDFTNNVSGYGGTILVISSCLTVTDSNIYSNNQESPQTINGIYAMLSALKLYNSTFDHLYGLYGGSLCLSTESYAEIYNCTFSNGGAETLVKADNVGGAIYAQQSTTLNITGSRFYNLNAQSAAGIYLYANSTLYLNYSMFENCNSKEGSRGSILKSYKSKVSITHSEFRNFDSTGIEGDTLNQLFIYNSSFSNGHGDLGGVIYCNECTNIDIIRSNFTYNSADDGGAIYISNSNANISECRFEVNSAGSGGAIYSSNNPELYVLDSYFFKNSANDTDGTKGVGGGIAVECPGLSDGCVSKIDNNVFEENDADRNGGGISWLDFEPEFKNNTYIKNDAKYGKDISCFQSGLKYYDGSSPLVTTPNLRQLEQETASSAMISGIAPGQTNSQELMIAVIDKYGQIVTTINNEVSLQIIKYYNSTVSGTTEPTKLDNGVFTFDKFIIGGIPGSTVHIKVEANGLIYVDDQKVSYIVIAVDLRECEMGESYSDTACTVCEPGKYSIDPTDLICNECPTEAVCHGSYIMTPKPGYWRKDQYTDTFYECPNTVACIGSSSNSSYSGECATGYTGNLCQSCEEGYSRTSKNECGSCPDPTSNGLKLGGILVGVIIVGVVMVKTTMDSAYKQKSLQSIYIKIFFNYLQLVMLTASFELDWPEYVLELFSVQEKAGTATDQIFSVDCFIRSRKSSEFSPEDVYYIKLLIMLVLPIIIFMITVIVWSCISFYYKSLKYFKSEFWATLVILVFIVHPNIVKAMFSAFSCMEIEGESWLKEDLQIRCWDDKHTLYALSVALPGIILWGLGIPTVCLFYLYINRRNLDNISVRLRFGFLFNGFKKSRFHWEFVILYRKIIIIFCSVFLSNLSVPVQALTVMIVLLISLHIQNVYQPYNHESLNQMEVRSILVAALTIYCGLYYLTGDLSEIAKLSFFVIIVVSNAYFIYYWLLKLLEASSHVLISKIPCLRRRFLKPIQDGFNEKMFIKESNNQNTLKKEGDVIFSLCPKPHQILSKPIDPQSYALLNLSCTKDLYLQIIRLKNYQQTLLPKRDPNDCSLITNPDSLFETGEMTEVDLESPVSLSPRHRSMFVTNLDTQS